MVNRFTTFPWKVGECREDLQQIYHLLFDVSKKRTTPCGGDSLKSLDFTGTVAAATGGLLGEVALQQAFESLAMAGLIAGHFIKTCATLGFAYNFLQLFYKYEGFSCNSFTTLYNFEELFERFHSNA